jgi:hypothetical protein
VPPIARHEPKAFAFGHGPHVLNAVIAVLYAGELAGGGATSAETANEKPIRMAIAARAIPVTAKTGWCLALTCRSC